MPSAWTLQRHEHGEATEGEVVMKDGKTPRNQEGQPPTKRGEDTADRLEEKADAQRGGANRARTEEKARDARTAGKGREVRFGG
jgi:hypothetical protein